MTDATALVVGLLKGAMPEVEVSGSVPADWPRAPMVTVSQVGGTAAEWVQRPILTLLCWAPSEAVANALALDCVLSLRSAAETHDRLSSVQQQSLSRDTWTADGSARYRLQLQLTINE